MTMCDVKWVACSDEPTGNHQATLQLYTAFYPLVAHCFVFAGHFQSHHSHSNRQLFANTLAIRT